MSQTPNYDAKVKAILDRLQPGERTCALTGEKWMMTEEEIGWYRKFNVPPHSWSPAVRMKQLCSFFTMYQFWYQRHPQTGAKFLSVAHPLSKVPVLPDEEWFASDFGSITQEADLNRSFFQQMRELQMRVPIPGTKFIKKPERSISIASFGDVDSYFMMACKSRDSLYGTDVNEMENSAECSGGAYIQNSYRVVQSHRIFNCKFVSGCYDCTDSNFLFDCRNCDHCFGATNKRNKSYLWFNQQLSKEDWERRMSEVDLSYRSKLEGYQKRFHELMVNDTVFPENFNEKCTNVVGEYLYNAVDCKYVFSGNDGPFRDCYWIIYLYGNSYDCAFSGAPVSSNRMYMSNVAVSSSNVSFSHMTTNCQNIEYCFYTWNCENCFGCFGLQRKKFCIFNKQYSEEEYWKKLDEVKCAMLDRGEYGRFFPSHFYPGYIMDGGLFVFEGTEDDVKKFEGTLFNPEDGGAVGDPIDSAQIRDAKTVPDCIDQVGDQEWANVPLYDAEFKRRFAFIKPELDFYRRFRIAPPTRHFVRRVYELFLQQNLPIFEQRACTVCNRDLLTTKHALYPDRKIVCKEHYLKYLEEHG